MGQAFPVESRVYFLTIEVPLYLVFELSDMLDGQHGPAIAHFLELGADESGYSLGSHKFTSCSGLRRIIPLVARCRQTFYLLAQTLARNYQTTFGILVRSARINYNWEISGGGTELV